MEATVLNVHYVIHIIGFHVTLISKGQPWPSSSDLLAHTLSVHSTLTTTHLTNGVTNRGGRMHL